MINAHGNHLTDLYTQNILGELFPECCFSYDKHIDCLVCVAVSENKAKATITIGGLSFETTEAYSSHLNNRLAITTAIGKSVIAFAKTRGVPPAPYGVLTGVRPFKIAIDLLSRFDYDVVINKLKNTYLVSEDKIELLLSAAMYDQKIRGSHNKNDASVYISIPFCPTRCNYCSFISSAAPSKLDLMDSYTDDIIKEIFQVADLFERKNLNLKSIYIGGGTPTVLSESLLDKLLKSLNQAFASDNLVEFTLEAGRPDTVTEKKVDMMKKYGVTRTCVNCQSTSDSVLSAIGRNHTAEDFFKAFELVKGYNFETLNTDIIAGLETDTFETFKKTVDDVISLSPESITVHTLCVKKSASIKLLDRIELNKNIDEYIQYSKSSCILSGYLPYYLYKQKYSVGNHENVGYCSHMHECYYNIAMMNEIEHVFGIGAGATSRLIGCNTNGKIEHFANYKYPTEYIGGYDKIKNNIEQIDSLL